MNKNNDRLSVQQAAEDKSATKDFTAQTCVRALMQSATEMADAVGVKISWGISGIEQDQDIKKAELMEALGRLTKAAGAMMVGGKVNLIKALDARDPVKLIRQFRRNNESK